MIRGTMKMNILGETMVKIIAVIAIVAALIMVGAGAWPFPDSGRANSGMSESVTIGNLPYIYSALIFIAEDQGYFSGNGLDVTIHNYDTATASINGMENRDVDLSLSPESSIVTEAFKKENIGVIACIDKYQSIYLIGRSDHGIKNASDLLGKKIGVPWKTIEFYLGRFLNIHGIGMQGITIVEVPPSQAVDAIIDGSVDALLIPKEYVNPVEKGLGSNFIIWPAQSSQLSYSVMACRDDWAASHQEAISRFLKSLSQAEEFDVNHPDEAKTILQRKLNYTDAYMAAVWPDHQFSLTLDQSLVLAMEDEGRWMIANNLTGEKEIPDFTDYIYTKGLEKAKPESVSIIR